MIRSTIVCVALLAMLVLSGVASAQSTQPSESSDNPYAVDFTKTLGKYAINRAEGQQVAGEGLKLTNLKEDGGPLAEGPSADISATPVAVIEIENKGSETVKLNFKVKSSEKKYTNDKVKVEAGKQTVKVDLSKSGIDLKDLTYVKLFGAGEVNLLVKSISFAKE